MPQIIVDVFAVADRMQVAAKGEIRLTRELLSGEQTQEKLSGIPGKIKVERMPGSNSQQYNTSPRKRVGEICSRRNHKRGI
jgi:hypothetical protein